MYDDVSIYDSSSNRNSLSVCSEGAVAGLKVVSAVMANMMVFVSILKFMDAILGWFALRAGLPGVTFAVSCCFSFCKGIGPKYSEFIAEAPQQSNSISLGKIVFIFQQCINWNPSINF